MTPPGDPVRLARGANAPLTAAVPGLRRVLVGLSWSPGPGVEVDAQVILVGADGAAASPDDLLFTWQLADAGPPAAGAAQDTEQVVVDLAAVPERVARIVASAAIYDAAARRQSFADVHDVHLRVGDAATGRELARHDLVSGAGEEGVTAVVLGELYRHAGGWKVRAVGQGYAGGLAAVARDVGLEV